jgi:hypothetical protein
MRALEHLALLIVRGYNQSMTFDWWLDSGPATASHQQGIAHVPSRVTYNPTIFELPGTIPHVYSNLRHQQ